MPTPSPHHRHQTSLEGVIEFSPTTTGNPCFHRGHRRVRTSANPRPYKQATLVRLTYEYALSEASRDNFLRFFFHHTQIPTDASQSESISTSEYWPRLTAFTETLIENFFLPLRASTRESPQPSLAALSDLQSAQLLTGTTQRLASLRRDCLIRDRHRRVISRSFDRDEARRRVAQDGTQVARDDAGILLSDESNIFATLEVAHIIPLCSYHLSPLSSLARSVGLRQA